MKHIFKKLASCALVLCLAAGMLTCIASAAGTEATAATVSSQIEALPKLGSYSAQVSVSELTAALSAYDSLAASEKANVSKADVTKIEAYRVSLKYARDNYEGTISGTGYTESEEISYLRFYRTNKDGSYWYIPSGFRSVITLTGSADSITVPIQWVKDFADYCAMPGDQFSFSVVVINKSSRNYSYQDKSLTVTLASNRTLANGWADDNFYNKLISFSPAKVNVNLPVLTNTLGSATDKTSSNYASLNSVFASALGTLKSGSESSSANAYMSLSAPGINNTYASVQFGASVDVTFSAEAEPIVLPDDPTPTGDKPVTPSDPTPTVTADTVTISDDDVPLASSPETGDTSVPLTVLAGICAASAVVLLATRRKKA